MAGSEIHDLILEEFDKIINEIEGVLTSASLSAENEVALRYAILKVRAQKAVYVKQWEMIGKQIEENYSLHNRLFRSEWEDGGFRRNPTRYADSYCSELTK